MLDIDGEWLMQVGEVSEACATTLCRQALIKTGADVAIGITGYAGPTGGSELEPLGSIWIAYGDKNKIYTRRLQLARDRNLNIKQAAYIALNSMRLFLIQER